MTAPTDTRPRTAEIASLVAGGEPTAAIAARYGITPRRVRAIAAATGNAPGRAGRPTTGAATHHTARGRAVLARLVELSAGEPEPALKLLARLLAIAAALGVEPGAVLDRLESPAVDEPLDLDNRCPRVRCRGDMEGGEFVDGSDNTCTKCGKRSVLVEYVDGSAAWVAQ